MPKVPSCNLCLDTVFNVECSVGRDGHFENLLIVNPT
jgi:hypothetical protein